MSVCSAMISMDSLNSTPCQVITSNESIKILSNASFKLMKELVPKEIEIKASPENCLIVSSLKDQFRCVLCAEDNILLYKELRRSTAMFKVRVNARSFSIRVMPEFAVLENRSETVRVRIDARTKLVQDFNELVIVKGRAVIPIFFESKYQCTTCATLLQLCRLLESPQCEETDLQCAFRGVIKKADFSEQVVPENMAHPPGKMLSSESYDYKRMPKMRVMTASQEASELLREQRAQQEQSRLSESVSAAVMKKRRKRHARRKNTSFDDASIISHTNTAETDGFEEEEIEKDIFEQFDDRPEESTEAEAVSQFFAKKSDKVPLQLRIDNGSVEEEQVETAKHINLSGAPETGPAVSMPERTLAELVSAPTPAFCTHFAKFCPNADEDGVQQSEE